MTKELTEEELISLRKTSMEYALKYVENYSHELDPHAFLLFAQSIYIFLAG